MHIYSISFIFAWPDIMSKITKPIGSYVGYQMYMAIERIGMLSMIRKTMEPRYFTRDPIS